MTGNPTDVTVWFTPDCGALHHAADQTISNRCPDGLNANWHTTP